MQLTPLTLQFFGPTLSIMIWDFRSWTDDNRISPKFHSLCRRSFFQDCYLFIHALIIQNVKRERKKQYALFHSFTLFFSWLSFSLSGCNNFHRSEKEPFEKKMYRIFTSFEQCKLSNTSFLGEIVGVKIFDRFKATKRYLSVSICLFSQFIRDCREQSLIFEKWPKLL